MDDNDKYQKVAGNVPQREYCPVCHKVTKQYLSITASGKFLTCNECGNVRKVKEQR